MEYQAASDLEDADWKGKKGETDDSSHQLFDLPPLPSLGQFEISRQEHF